MTSISRAGGDKSENERRGWGLASVLFSFTKENMICAMTRHHTKMYYLQEIFLLTLTSDSEAIL